MLEQDNVQMHDVAHYFLFANVCNVCCSYLFDINKLVLILLSYICEAIFHSIVIIIQYLYNIYLQANALLY